MGFCSSLFPYVFNMGSIQTHSFSANVPRRTTVHRQSRLPCAYLSTADKHITNDKQLFCFGLGYTASRLASVLQTQGWTVYATVRSTTDVTKLARLGITPVNFNRAEDSTCGFTCGLLWVLEYSLLAERSGHVT